MSDAMAAPGFAERILIRLANLLPTSSGVLGLPRLLSFRTLLRKFNLLPAPLGADPPLSGPPPAFRTSDASGNNPQHPRAGASATPFGRNMPAGPGGAADIADGPPVQVVAQKLLACRKFVPAGDQLNVLAAAWIQAMAHDWMGHVDSKEVVELDQGATEGAQCPMAKFQFHTTQKRAGGGFENERTHWWDASFVYGQDEEAVRRGRTGNGGKLKEGDKFGLLPIDSEGLSEVGDARNSWVGVSLLQDLFLREHNYVAGVIAQEHPELAGDDDKLFNYARLVISALVAKIHTIDCKFCSNICCFTLVLLGSL